MATRVDAGELEPRMDVPSGGGEVKVLAEAFNNMLDRLTGELKGQREFIADASHELRTPITVIRGQLEVLAAQEHPSAEDVRRAEEHVQREITRISRLVDDLLLLAQAEHPDFLRPERIELRTFVEQLWDGISLTADRRFELGPVPGRHAARRSRPAGPGAAQPRPATRSRRPASTAALVRSRSTSPRPGRSASRHRRRPGDSSQPSASACSSASTAPIRPAAAAEGGAGLGLAIVRAIAEAHHGEVRAVAAARRARPGPGSSWCCRASSRRCRPTGARTPVL